MEPKPQKLPTNQSPPQDNQFAGFTRNVPGKNSSSKKLWSVLALFFVVAGATWLTILSTDDLTTKTTITSFDECVAAGNPVMEIYPEQCNADGVTYTNTDQIVNDKSIRGTRVASGKNGFSLIFPYGLEITKVTNEDVFTKGIFGDSSKPPVVNLADGHGSDGPSYLFIYMPVDADTGTPEGEKSILTLGGNTVEKHVKVYTEDTLQGYPDSRKKGDVAYVYDVSLSNGKQVIVFHNLLVDQPNLSDRSVEIEAMLATIQIP